MWYGTPLVYRKAITIDTQEVVPDPHQLSLLISRADKIVKPRRSDADDILFTRRMNQKLATR